VLLLTMAGGMEVADASDDRRRTPRVATHIEVDYRTEGTYLFASITDISARGIFVRTDEPLPQGTRLELRFSPPALPGVVAGPPLVLDGEVVWVTYDDHCGMGVRFLDVAPEDHDRLLDLVRAIAYLDDRSAN
jgi:type IV pilus assembly protein PilZ